MEYIVYDINGNILRAGYCQKCAFHLQAGNGEFVMKGKANDIKHKIKEGKVVDKKEKLKDE